MPRNGISKGFMVNACLISHQQPNIKILRKIFSPACPSLNHAGNRIRPNPQHRNPQQRALYLLLPPPPGSWAALNPRRLARSGTPSRSRTPARPPASPRAPTGPCGRTALPAPAGLPPTADTTRPGPGQPRIPGKVTAETEPRCGSGVRRQDSFLHPESEAEREKNGVTRARAVGQHAPGRSGSKSAAASTSSGSILGTLEPSCSPPPPPRLSLPTGPEGSEGPDDMTIWAQEAARVGLG